MNEVQVSLDDVGRVHLRLAGDRAKVIYTLETTEALRAFFQAERDEQLGRWRDPKNPDMVVYPHDDANTTVHDETTGVYLNWSREQAEDDEYSHGFGFVTARAYFEAHPEPKPWEDAQPDEIWVLTIGGYSAPYLRNWAGRWTNSTSNVYVGDGAITAGRRIWPEGEAS